MVDQTRFELPDGNCGAACLATIFGVDIDEAPNMNVEGWEHSVSKWTRQFGYWVLNCTFLVGEYPQGIALAGVPSRRLNGKQHCVIFEDGRLLHDPNPDRERWDPYTVDDVLEWTLFVAFDPTAGKPSSDPRDAVVAAALAWDKARTPWRELLQAFRDGTRKGVDASELYETLRSTLERAELALTAALEGLDG